MDTFIYKVQDPIFTCRVKSGLLDHNGEPVLSRTAEAYLRAVGQTFANVGNGDPRLIPEHTVDRKSVVCSGKVYQNTL